MKFLSLNYRETFDEPYVELNVTSRSTDWGKALSPFLLGPVVTVNGTALNVENAWQYSKIWPMHWDEEKQEPRPAYWYWRQKGFDTKYGQRYPFGKEEQNNTLGTWLGKKGERGRLVPYTQAKRLLYVPTYQQALRASAWYPTFIKFIADAYHTDTNLVFRDFDTFNHYEKGMTLMDILNSSDHRYGHGFILVDEAQKFISSHEVDFSEFAQKIDTSSDKSSQNSPSQ